MFDIYAMSLVYLLLISCLGVLSNAERLEDQRVMAADDSYLLPPGFQPNDNFVPPSRDMGQREFTLRHIYHHGVYDYSSLHRYLDIPKDAELMVTLDEGERLLAPESFTARIATMNIQRMTDRSRSTVDNLLNHAAMFGEEVMLPASAWTVDEIPGPNTTDKATVVAFARMAANAYVTEPFTGDWQDVGGGFNYTDDFGWELNGLRGHIFVDEANSTVVIGMKGTSFAVFDGDEPTTNDKINDNILASCCCGQGGQYRWKQACDCMTSAYTCNSTCLVKSLQEKNHYYSAARNLYHHVAERYPNADIWATGHSLGGVISSLLGLTYGLPVMTYEAYPDALAASRLGLPVPPGYRAGFHQARSDLGIYHYGQTADPVFTGECNTALSTCTLAGYAMEGICHSGKTCRYDTMKDLGWRSNIGNHRILSVISNVLEKYDEVPACEADVDCLDCFNWKFFESNGTEKTPVTSSSSSGISTSSSMTRTETCKTPGWWGCRDATTTTATSTSTKPTSTTSTTSTSSCKTPGWFGCKDPTTTTTTSATQTPTSQLASTTAST